MSSLSSQVARAHARWLEPIDYLYTRDDIEDKCEEINKLLNNFSEEWCGGIEESYNVSETITATKDLLSTLRSLLDDLEEIEENQDPHQEDY